MANSLNVQQKKKLEMLLVEKLATPEEKSLFALQSLTSRLDAQASQFELLIDLLSQFLLKLHERSAIKEEPERLVGGTTAAALVVQFDDVSPAVPTENDFVALRGSSRRSLYTETVGRTQSTTFTATGSGATVDVSIAGAKSFGLQVTGTGAAPTAWEVVLEGSLNNSNFSTILTHASANGQTNGEVMFTGAAAMPCRYFRSRVVSLTLGAATNIVVIVWGL